MSAVASGTTEFNFRNANGMANSACSGTFTTLDSPILSEKSSSRVPFTPSPTLMISLVSWIGSTGNSKCKSSLVATPSMGSSMSMGESDASQDLRSSSQGSIVADT
ncbi:hypothetical protein NE237_000740 [Protea cynaroides]|uniref:Uncharacterized protein n=1 Tax=Protea cynaroides TaxID=273540 RepID=A0A9Q0KS54_9MAGN|nr:hypothetical protein NE237_000740 [Protea cynaroides]